MRGLKVESGNSTQGHREEPMRDKQLKLVPPSPLRLDDSDLFLETEEPGSRVSKGRKPSGLLRPFWEKQNKQPAGHVYLEQDNPA